MKSPTARSSEVRPHLPVRRGVVVPLAAMAFAIGALLTPFAALADAAKARAAVESVLAEMERAVLAGDAELYLKHVATDDAVFLQEQRMWAADLKRHVPESFDLRIIDPAERAANEAASRQGAEEQPSGDDAAADAHVHEFTTDRAMFELAMKWKMTVPRAEGEAGEPRIIDREVSYPVVFEYMPVDGQGRWLFKGERWVEVRAEAAPDNAEQTRAHRGENIALCFPGYEGVSKRIVDMLPEIRAHVDGLFEQDVPHEQAVKIYPTMRHLQASIYLSYWDGLSGWNEPKESIKLLVRPNSSRESLQRLLAHEYGHVVTFEMGPKATDIAWWVLEGVAELAAEQFSPNAADRAERTVLAWAADGRLADFDKISDFRNTHKDVMRNVYTQGQHMSGYIARRFGQSKLNNWLRAMANGAVIEEAATKELGVPGGFTEIDRDWRSEVMSRVREEEP